MINEHQDLLTLLDDGILQLGLDVQSDGLLNYLNLLLKWNQAYNLTLFVMHRVWCTAIYR